MNITDMIREKKEIQMKLVSTLSVVEILYGTHTVYFFGENETLEITHTVNSRSIFAKGAIKAAYFILKQKNGLYSMKDLF